MRYAAVMSLVVLLGACATAQPSTPASSLLRSDWQPAAEQSCQLLTTPATLPEAGQILDVSAARVALASAAGTPHGSAPYAVLTSAPAAPPRTPPYAILEVRFDSVGALQPVRLLDRTVSAEVAAALVQSVVPTAPKGVSENERGWGVLVKATAVEEAGTFAVERMEYCACALINRKEFTRALGAAVKRVDLPALAGTRQQLIIEVRSDSTGAILEKRLSRSTGHVELDRMVVRLADQMRVAPALLNRRPLNGWSRLPVAFTLP